MKITTLRSGVRESLFAGAVAMAAAAGCGNNAPIDPGAMSTQAADTVSAVFESAALAVSGNKGVERASSRLADGFGVMSDSFGKVSTSGMSAPGPMPALAPVRSAMRNIPALRSIARPFATESLFGPSPVGGALYATEEPSELASDIDESGKLIGRFLRERVFAGANLESKSDSEAVYRLKPDPTCRDLESNELDRKCVDELTKVELRIRLSRAGDKGGRFEILVGSERARPVALVITDVQIALELYLGEVKRTSAILARQLGGEDDTPAVLEGALRWALTKEGPRQVAFHTAIFEKLHVEQHGARAVENVVIRSAVADPLFKLAADGAAGTITASVGYGMTEVFGPWEPEDKPADTQVHVVAPGLTGQVTFTQASETVKFANLGLGPSPLYVEVRGQRILEVNLNERDGRAYGADVTFAADGTPRIDVAPRFDLSLGFKLAAVASDFKEAPPAHLLDERYQLVLEAAGGNPSIGPAGRDGNGGLRVFTGKLSLSSSKVATPVTVEAGQCLLGVDPAPGAHPVLGAFKSGPCP